MSRIIELPTGFKEYDLDKMTAYNMAVLLIELFDYSTQSDVYGTNNIAYIRYNSEEVVLEEPSDDYHDAMDKIRDWYMSKLKELYKARAGK